MGLSLISSTSLVQTPYIKVTIGKYSFGCYNKDAVGTEKYPNYINSLEITKLNGKFNTYKLNIVYTINEFSDPNFFEKVFSSVSSSREITFTYGDLSATNFIYKNEEGMITNVYSNMNVENCTISYTVEAVSKGILATTGCQTFPVPNNTKVKPSKIIKDMLNQNNIYGLQDLFPGMRNLDMVDQLRLIPDNDVEVELNTKVNMSVLDYLQYLVSSMRTTNSTEDVRLSNFFILTFVDDTSGQLGGTYFKIVEVDKNKVYPDAYELYIGYPTSNLVHNLSVQNNETYAIYYNYNREAYPTNYVERIDAYGNKVQTYAPAISSKNSNFETNPEDRSWWTKVSQYPITLSLDIKGLLRPAILMTYVKLHIKFFSKLHIHSGVYIITKQVDRVDQSGYRTSLSMTRVADDPEMLII